MKPLPLTDLNVISGGRVQDEASAVQWLGQIIEALSLNEGDTMSGDVDAYKFWEHGIKYKEIEQKRKEKDDAWNRAHPILNMLDHSWDIFTYEFPTIIVVAIFILVGIIIILLPWACK